MGRPVSPRMMRYQCVEAQAPVQSSQRIPFAPSPYEATPSPAPVVQVTEEPSVDDHVRKGLPSSVKVVVRGFMLVGLLFSFLYFDLYAPLEPKVPITGYKFTLYMTGVISIATVFCTGYLLLTREKRGRAGIEADIPSMLLVFAKVGLSMGIAYAAYYFDLIPRFAMLLLLACMAVAWSVFATASFTYYAFHRLQ